MSHLISRIFFIIFSLIWSSACGQKYYTASGKSFKVRNPVKDEKTITESEFNKRRFVFDDNLSSQKLDNAFYYVGARDVVEYSRKNEGYLLVIIFYPKCKSAENQYKVAKYAEEHKIPYLMLSQVNEPELIHKLNVKFDVAYKTPLIIPSGFNYSELLVKKQIQFLSEISPELYGRRKDMLMFENYVVLKNGAFVASPGDDKHYVIEESFNWIKNFFSQSAASN